MESKFHCGSSPLFKVHRDDDIIMNFYHPSEQFSYKLLVLPYHQNSIHHLHRVLRFVPSASFGKEAGPLGHQMAIRMY